LRQYHGDTTVTLTRAPSLAAQPERSEGATVQVMPVGVARIDQPLAAARAGRKPVKARRHEVADQ